MAITASPRSLRSAPSREAHSRGRGATAAPRRTAASLLSDVLGAPLSDYYLILGAGVVLVGFGILMVLSSSSVYASVEYHDAYYYVKRQAVFLTVGGLLCWWLSRMKPTMLRWLGWAGLILAFVMLLLTFTPLGNSVGGNRNWLNLGSWVRIQPSEFAKLAMVVWGADLLSRRERELDRPMRLMIPYLPVCALLIGLVIAERDLGTAMVMTLIVAGVLFVVGTSFRLMAVLGLVASAGVGLLVVTSPNRMARIAAFLTPSKGTEQGLQALYALASGGWWGRGLGQSRQKWGLPAAHTDFVLAILGEEVGLIGALVVMILFFVLGFAGIRTALRSDSAFTRFTAAGITAWFMIQAVMNMAVVLNLLPVLGVTLPFISYGGSSLLANLLAFGVLLACARNEPGARSVLQRKLVVPAPTVTTIVDGGRD